MMSKPAVSENHAIVYAKTGKVEKLLECLENGVSPNLVGLLHCAAERGKLEVVKLLLARGADPNQKDEDWATPLFYARQKGQAEVERLLEPLTSQCIGYSVDKILRIEDVVEAYFTLWDGIRHDYARGLSPAELRVLSLRSFLEHGALNGIDDMVWQGGFWSVGRAIELLEAIREPALAADLREAEAIIRDQAARSGYDLDSEYEQAQGVWEDFITSIEPRLAAIHERLMNLFYGNESDAGGAGDRYRRLCAATLDYVRENRELFSNADTGSGAAS